MFWESEEELATGRESQSRLIEMEGSGVDEFGLELN